MHHDWITLLTTAFKRPADDPLMTRIIALFSDLDAGRISEEQASARLAGDTPLHSALVDFQNAQVQGGIQTGDIVGGNKITNILNQLPPAPPPDPLIAAREKLQALPLDTIPEPASLPQPYRMPLSRNPLFVGREDDLKLLATVLKGGTTAVVGQVKLAAATGLGGIGKSQLASEFVHRYGQFFHSVFWLSFADPQAVPAEFAACGGGGGMNLDDFTGLSLAEQVARVREAWGEALPRLLVFDNCEDEQVLDRWRPQSGGCRVLLTSRRATWDPQLNVVRVPLAVLTLSESIALLRQYRPDLSADDPDLRAIAQELGHLPLALNLAGSFLKLYCDDVTPASYLTELEQALGLDHESFDGEGISATAHDLSVARTFRLSYDRLNADDPVDNLALGLLARAAHFAPGEPIPRDLLKSSLQASVDDRKVVRQVTKALQRLIDLGLLEQEAEGRLRLHRLLVRFVRTISTDNDAQAAVEQVVLQVANRFNNKGYPAPLLKLQAHLRAITEVAQKRGDELATGLCNTLGYHLDMIGDYAGARPYYERALVINEQVLGDSHPDTAASLNNLGSLLQAQGDYVGARPYFERALAIREQVLGASHPDTANSLNNLARLLQMIGDYVGARPYYERALAICEQRLGPTHPTTQIIRHNLAAVAQPPQSAAEQIAAVEQGAKQAVDSVLKAGTVEQRAALADQLEAVAQQAEAGEREGSPYFILADRLRVLRAQLENAEQARDGAEQPDDA